MRSNDDMRVQNFVESGTQKEVLIIFHLVIETSRQQ